MYKTLLNQSIHINITFQSKKNQQNYNSFEPNLQSQLNESMPSMHIPLFKQGDSAQSSMLVSHNAPLLKFDILIDILIN